MTKSKLIELLKDFPDDSEIIVNGHSDGGDYDVANNVTSLNVARYEKNSWRGTHYESPIGKLAILIN